MQPILLKEKETDKAKQILVGGLEAKPELSRRIHVVCDQGLPSFSPGPRAKQMWAEQSPPGHLHLPPPPDLSGRFPLRVSF